jgi:predicted negative regulator of RcsB-dependent stress response
VRAETRHRLKEDQFSKATLSFYDSATEWVAAHQKQVIAALVAVLLIVVAAAGIWYYFQQQDEKASVEFGQALRTYETPLRPASMPAQPDFPSYTSAKERAGDAHKKFQAIVDKYPHTHAADFARYFAGLTAAQTGDNTTAERELKDVSSVRNKDLASLAKFALAAVYRTTNRDKEAIDLYKQIIDKPTASVSKATAQMELADFYQDKQQTAEAKRILEQVQKENPNSEIASLASQKLGTLK